MGLEWTCSVCRGKPALVHRGAYDGWIRIEMAQVHNGAAVREGRVLTLCSIPCVLAALDQIGLEARAAGVDNERLGVDELREKVDEI